MSPRRRKAEDADVFAAMVRVMLRVGLAELGELRADTDVQAMARMIEVTLGGSFLAWTIYREGPAAKHLREDLDATLRPYLTRGVERAG